MVARNTGFILGGNALGTTLGEQMAAVKNTEKLPKRQAAICFIKSKPGRKAIIHHWKKQLTVWQEKRNRHILVMKSFGSIIEKLTRILSFLLV